MEHEYIKGTIKGKVMLLSFLAALLSIYLIIRFLMLTYIPEPIDATLQASNQYIKNMADAIVYVNIFMLSLYIYGAYFCYKLGNSIKRSNQYPPPNTNVPFTKKIVRGKKALLQAYASYSGSAMLIAFGSYELFSSMRAAKLLRDLTIAF